MNSLNFLLSLSPFFGFCSFLRFFCFGKNGKSTTATIHSSICICRNVPFFLRHPHEFWAISMPLQTRLIYINVILFFSFQRAKGITLTYLFFSLYRSTAYYLIFFSEGRGFFSGDDCVGFGSAQFGFVYLWNRAYPRKYSSDINSEQNDK